MSIIDIMTVASNTPADILIDRAKSETRISAFLTPWGIRECLKMTPNEIALTFGIIASEFWCAVRAGTITGVALRLAIKNSRG